MNKMMKKIIFILTAIGLISIIFYGWRSYLSFHNKAVEYKTNSNITINNKAIGAGAKAPLFTLPALDGKNISLSSLKGKVVLLNFWASWCPPCLEEMPSLQVLYKKLQSKPFELLAVNIDEDGVSSALPVVQKLDLNFPILLDPPQETTRKYGTIGVPETYIIDTNGIVVEKIFGPRDWSKPENQASIEVLLK